MLLDRAGLYDEKQTHEKISWPKLFYFNYFSTKKSADNYLGSSALVVEGHTDPEVMEAVACREGLALASDLGLQSFRIASDCANVVRSLLGEGFGRYGPIVQEINVRKRSFMRAEFVHEGRKSNVDAHLLARSSVNLSIGRHVWFMEPPDGVCNSYVIE
jgi:hypothetical protein